MLGKLYLVATPIGNKEDISLRALRILSEVDCIAAEDTRHSQFLLHHYHIQTPLISLHAFNETHKVTTIIKKLTEGMNIALISDAGTPLISDPGFILVNAAQLADIPIIPIPGACAAIVALCASGLPTDRFIFEGFLSTKSGPRKRQLESLQYETGTLIFYEAPHRIISCVQLMTAIWGAERKIVLAKELTKQFETFFRGTLASANQWLETDFYHTKGEFVIIVQGYVRAEETVSLESERVLRILKEVLPLCEAVKITAKITGEKKNKLKTSYKN